ncbi:VOC family protein [Saccharopolyspora indica]|uniref:VOC family protein n=1 Tax=Saccharopolyspora indica TaxID=1229659 RepID=UPI0022EB3E62|nr:VOC family protein [Saccharopolyspora indica]MDA3646740.1 VOC family protein [Saccharopolyspora indica]
MRDVEFDHLLHWVPDVGAAAREYAAAGFPAHVNEPLSGFQNAGWRLDERYVEILTVVDEEAFETSPYAPAWELLRPAVAAVGGGGALTFAVTVPDAAATAERLRGLGHRVVEAPVSFGELGFLEVFAPDTPSWAPFFITYDPPREQLLAQAGPDAFDPGPHDLEALVVETPDPERDAHWLGELLDIPATGAEVPLPGARVVFDEGPAERITGVLVSGPGPDVVIGGLRFAHSRKPSRRRSAERASDSET